MVRQLAQPGRASEPLLPGQTPRNTEFLKELDLKKNLHDDGLADKSDESPKIERKVLSHVDSISDDMRRSVNRSKKNSPDSLGPNDPRDDDFFSEIKRIRAVGRNKKL